MELKSIPNALKAVDDRTVVGIAAVFGNVDAIGDRIWPGGFTKTIAERRPKFRHLWNHDFFSPPIAHITDIREVNREALPEQVLALAPNAVGGLEVTRRYLETARGDEVLAGIKAGAINEMSFGFDVIPGKLSFTNEGDERIRELHELRLYDTSDVLWGMNEATTAAKFAPPLHLLLKQLEQVLAQQKAGARHSAADVQLLNAIHRAAVELGCNECKGILDSEDDDAKSRAAVRRTLTQLDQRLRLLSLEVDL